jgi:hypothetical protein
MPGNTDKTDRKLTLEWAELGDGGRALIFDRQTCAMYEAAAAARGQTAHQIISTAVAGAFGTVMMDNYTLNRFLKADDPDFLRSGGKTRG